MHLQIQSDCATYWKITHYLYIVIIFLWLQPPLMIYIPSCFCQARIHQSSFYTVMPYVNIPHRSSCYILAILWFWRRKSFFPPSPFSILLERCYILFFLILVYRIWALDTPDPLKHFTKFYVPYPVSRPCLI